MNLALILPGFSASAHDWAIPALQHLARELAHRHTVTVFSLRYPDKGVYQFDGLVHRAVGGGQHYGWRKGWFMGQMLRAIWQQHQHKPFDMFHAFWADEAGLVATCAAKLFHRPSLVSLGGWELTHLPQIRYGAQQFRSHRLLIGQVLRQANLVTAGSAYQLHLARQHRVSAEKLHFAPLGVDTQHFRPDPQPISPFTLIQVASLLPVKNQALLWQVLHEVKRTLPEIRLNMVGSGPLEAELRALAESLDITANITWHQKIPHLALPAYYQQSQLYVQTSWHESQGMAVLEAMACGLPVIGTEVGVMPEVACLPPTSSVSELSEQIITLSQSPERYTVSAQVARHKVEQTFSLTASCAKFEELYRGLLRFK